MIFGVLFVLFFFKQKTAYEMLRSLVGSEMCIRDRSGRHDVKEGFLVFSGKAMVPLRTMPPLHTEGFVICL